MGSKKEQEQYDTLYIAFMLQLEPHVYNARSSCAARRTSYARRQGTRKREQTTQRFPPRQHEKTTSRVGFLYAPKTTYQRVLLGVSIPLLCKKVRLANGSDQ